MWRGTRRSIDQWFDIDPNPVMIVEDVNARVGENLGWVAKGRIEFHLNYFVATPREAVRVVEYVERSRPTVANAVARRIVRGNDATAAHLRCEKAARVARAEALDRRTQRVVDDPRV